MYKLLNLSWPNRPTTAKIYKSSKEIASLDSSAKMGLNLTTNMCLRKITRAEKSLEFRCISNLKVNLSVGFLLLMKLVSKEASIFSKMKKIINSTKQRKLIAMSTILKTFMRSLEKLTKNHN